MGATLASQGYFWWPGITTFLHGTMTLAHGITPSLAQIYIAPQLTWPDAVGDLTVSYLPGGSIITLTDCLLDFVSIERGPDGRQVWGLHILDRRWKWKDCGKISGNYNVRRTNGDGESAVWAPTKIELKELMQLCLVAMGEDDFGFDLSDVPAATKGAGIYPEIEWDYDNPAKALLDLCDKYGYRIVLQLDNTVKIATANVGEYLDDSRYMSGASTLNPPNLPSAIVVAVGRSVAQYDFPLEAVGLELDGTLLPIDELSYTPQAQNSIGLTGWRAIGADLQNFTSVAAEFGTLAQSYAQKSVYRYFRLVPPFEFEQLDNIDPLNNFVEDINYVLPILETQLDKAPATADAPAQPRPAWVYGQWCTEADWQNNVEQDAIDSATVGATEDKQLYPRSFTIDRERGLVIFDDCVFAFSEGQASGKDTSGSIFEPTLFLRTTCNVRDAVTFGWLRREYRVDLPGAQTNTKPMYVKTEDAGFQAKYNFTGLGDLVGGQGNDSDLQAQAAAVAQSELAKMQLDDPQSFEYPGLRFDQELDGAIQQITWTVDGGGKATTQCNRNKEDLVNTPSYEEQKKAALLQMALANSEKLSRVKKQDLAQNLTVSGT
jgi:hypothetical protein